MDDVRRAHLFWEEARYTPQRGAGLRHQTRLILLPRPATRQRMAARPVSSCAMKEAAGLPLGEGRPPQFPVGHKAH